MKLPAALIESLRGLPGFEEQHFLELHEAAHPVTSIRINPARVSGTAQLDLHEFVGNKVPWTSTGFYLRERPSFTFDPEFHAGCYYVQESSSMFIEQALLQWDGLSGRDRVLDLSAAPGGKSTHLHALLSADALLVCNEVIRARARILEDQLIKWGASNAVVTQNDPRDFARLESFFDVMLVDAPCSGSGLFRRDPEAIAEWSTNTVQLCSQRQQRILADAWPCLRAGGLLIYSTCSYSKDENEGISQWLIDHFDVEEIHIDIPATWPVTVSSPGYRFWPGAAGGEGFYFAAFRKREGKGRATIAKSTFSSIAGAEINRLDEWLPAESFRFTKNQDTINGFPALMAEEMRYLQLSLRCLNAGLRVGEIIRDALIPDHALALSGNLREGVPRVDLPREAAIAYLGKRETEWPQMEKGWRLVSYKNLGLGWIKALGHRVNNYYPQHLRILKEKPR